VVLRGGRRTPALEILSNPCHIAYIKRGPQARQLNKMLCYGHGGLKPIQGSRKEELISSKNDPYLKESRKLHQILVTHTREEERIYSLRIEAVLHGTFDLVGHEPPE
jgi:hypothetical protein